MRVSTRWTASLMVLLAACGQTASPAQEDAAQDLAADVATDDGLNDMGLGDTLDAVDAVDTAADATAEVADAAVDDLADVAPDVGQCVIDDECADKLTLSPCQLPKCAAGTCIAVQNPDACCVDTDCDDGNECNTHKCDQLQHKCANVAIANCCSGKVLLQNATFETSQDGFVATDGAENGNVGWQLSAWRVHGGKQSLYFGNACHTYDNSMTTPGACAPAYTDTKPVSTTLLSKTYLLPTKKKAQAHFWLWLDTEPSYATTMPLGACNPPCNAASTCIVVAGSSVCEPEKDVMSLQVLAPDAPPAPVFWSTQIGKSTLGDPLNPSGWRHITVDLSSWQGKSIQLAWQFNTKTNANNGYEGIYLDDVVVETICDVDGVLCNDAQTCTDDGLVCTADTCTAYSNAEGQGVCFHDNIAACCLGDADCDDGNACTVDTCSQNTCKSQLDAGKSGCCKPALLFSDLFDAAPLTNWVNLEQNSVSALWRVNPKGGNPAVGTNGGGSHYFGNASYSNYEDGSLQPGEGPRGVSCAKPIDLKVGTNYKLLTFDLNLDTEWSDVAPAKYLNPPIPGNAKLDWFAVEVRTGGDKFTIWSSDAIQGTTHGKWLPVTVSLDAWSGKSVQVCVRFDAGDDVLNDKPGVNIDNLTVSEACEKSECYWDSDCGQKSCGTCQQASCSGSICVCTAVSNCP